MKLSKKSGFTLIEILVSIVLIGILAVILSYAGVHLVDSFIYTKANTATLQKGQIAIARIQKELNNVKTVSASSATSITFTSYRDGGTPTHTLSWAGNGNNLLLDGVTLTDKVNSFSLAYYATYDAAATTAFSSDPKTTIIEVNLVIKGYEDITSSFHARVAPSFDTSVPGI